MIEVNADLWTYPADYRVITTNGLVKKDGTLVMGRGCAKQAKDRYKWLPKMLGDLVTHFGNRVFLLPKGLISFPVKHVFYQQADPILIKRSVNQLEQLINLDKKTVIMPRPGCGNGRLNWKNIKSMLIHLPDNVVICDFLRF